MATSSHELVRRRQQLRDEYVSRINCVLDHIERNLDGDLSLESLARVAAFSPYHFHRIFGAMMGETLHQYIQRQRLEKAAQRLVQHPRTSVTEIALDSGFAGSASFARAFKEAFGMSASEWRREGHRSYRKDDRSRVTCAEMFEDERGDWGILSQELDPETRDARWTIGVKGLEPVEVEVVREPDLHVAYVRHIGPYQGLAEVFQDLFGRLMRWATPRGLLQDPRTRILAVYHDNPEITDDAKLRVDACVTVPEGTRVDGEVGSMALPGGSCAVGHFALADDEYHLGWYALVGGWLPESGYQPDDRLCYESYPPQEPQRPDGRSLVDICVPVRPL